MFPLNLHGRICFIFSLGWGFLCLLLVYVINPAVERVVEMPSQALSATIAAIMFVVMLTDLIFTIRATVNLNETLMKLEKVRSVARVRSSEFTGGIQERMAVIAKSFVIWRKQVREIGYIQRRLLRAFPHMRSLRYQESIERLRGCLMAEDLISLCLLLRYLILGKSLNRSSCRQDQFSRIHLPMT